jgi:hypothetical protein
MSVRDSREQHHAGGDAALYQDILSRMLSPLLRCLAAIEDRQSNSHLSEDDKVVDVVVSALLRTTITSVGSILALTEELSPKVRDSFPITRGIVETCINAGTTEGLGEWVSYNWLTRGRGVSPSLVLPKLRGGFW